VFGDNESVLIEHTPGGHAGADRQRHDAADRASPGAKSRGTLGRRTAFSSPATGLALSRRQGVWTAARPRLPETPRHCAALPTRAAAALLSLVLLSACAHRFPADYRLADLRADSATRPGEALVHFLLVPGNDATACVAGNLARTDHALLDPFFAALEAGRLPAAAWEACAATLLPSLAPEARERFFAELAPRALDFAARPELAKLQLVHRLLAGRPREPSPALSTLRAKLAAVTVAPAATRLRAEVDELRRTLELDDGLLEGAPLTPARVEALDDEALLRRVEARSPRAEVRLAARRRVVRLHLAAATMPEVQARAAEVEAAVLEHGRWVQPAAGLPPAIALPPRTLELSLRASQNVATQLARLSTSDDPDGRDPRVDLKPLLRFSVGWSRPLALCAPPEALDVHPCIDPREVTLGTGFATLRPDGVLAFPETLVLADLVELTRGGFGLVVPVQLGQRTVQVLQVPLVVLQPGPFYFEGALTEPGPAVNVVAVPVAQGLLLEAVDAKGTRKQVVLPRGPTVFELGSRGGAGKPGSPGLKGADGARGNNGMSASCPSMNGTNGGPGGSGQPGTSGGAGGRGGDGGPVKVELHCGGACEDEALLRAIVRSVGGPGGAGGQGGAGGRGGDGGSGGSGTSCYSNGRSTYLSGGSQGSRGSDGARGQDGPRGAPGSAGPVQVLRR
jgi:hypothetical protein